MNAILPISHRVGAELIADIGPQLPARAEELAGNSHAVQELLIRRFSAGWGNELGSDEINPGHLSFLELGLIGGRIIGEFTRGILTDEGPDARFRSGYLEFDEDKYAEDSGIEPTLLERVVQLGDDVDRSVPLLVNRFLERVAGSWLQPYIERYDELSPIASHSEVSTIREALGISSLGDTTTDIIRLTNSLPYMIPGAKKSDEPIPIIPNEKQREDAALDLLYLSTTRASTHAGTFIRSARLHHLEGGGYILKREPQEGQDRTLHYLFQPYDRTILRSIMPHTKDVAPEAENNLLVKCFAHQPYNPGRLQKDGTRVGGSRFTGLQLLSRAVVRVAADKRLFAA